MSIDVVTPLIAGLGTTELLIIVGIIVLLFGASKLPELARGSGRELRIFKAETKGLRDDSDTTADAGTPGAGTTTVTAQPIAPPPPSPPPPAAPGGPDAEQVQQVGCGAGDERCDLDVGLLDLDGEASVTCGQSTQDELGGLLERGCCRARA